MNYICTISYFYQLYTSFPSAELFSLSSLSLANGMSFSLAFFFIIFFSTKDERKAEGFDRFIACKSMKGATKNFRLNG